MDRANSGADRTWQIVRWFQRAILARPWAAFLTLAVSFVVFGAGSLNLLYLFKANFELLVNYGWQAAMDGGLQQLFELVVTGLLSLAAYVVFKACEHALVDALSGTATVHAVRHPDFSDARNEHDRSRPARGDRRALPEDERQRDQSRDVGQPERPAPVGDADHPERSSLR
jgi:hypothetical protein